MDSLAQASTPKTRSLGKFSTSNLQQLTFYWVVSKAQIISMALATLLHVYGILLTMHHDQNYYFTLQSGILLEVLIQLVR